MTPTVRRFGAALAALYVAAALATTWWAPGRMRPLFDGFGTHPGSYNWVTPPKEFVDGNLRPESTQARLTFSVTGSSPVRTETPDGQAMVALTQGAVPPHPSDTAARLDLRPVDSTTLGPLPPGMRPEGNAYQATVTHLPSNTQVTTMTTPGTVGVTSEAASDTLLFSADGRSWRPTQATPLSGANGLTGPFTEAGYYLAAGRGDPRAPTDGDGPPVALFILAAAVPLVLGYLLLGRRRQPNRPPVPRRPSGRRRPQAPSNRRPPPRKPKPKNRKKKKR